jgi:phosphatidyl-myo-inositol dimannoside synthase
VHYHIVGIPSEQMAFAQLAQALDVSKHVTFYGAVSQDQLPAMLGGADVFLMLSERLPNGDVEGFGIAILEANHLGLPAIGSADSGIADAIQNGISGRLVPPGNPQAVVSAVQEIMSNHEDYAVRARSWTDAFRWENVIQKYLEVFERMTDNRPATSIFHS